MEKRVVPHQQQAHAGVGFIPALAEQAPQPIPNEQYLKGYFERESTPLIREDEGDGDPVLRESSRLIREEAEALLRDGVAYDAVDRVLEKFHEVGILYTREFNEHLKETLRERAAMLREHEATLAARRAYRARKREEGQRSGQARREGIPERDACIQDLARAHRLKHPYPGPRAARFGTQWLIHQIGGDLPRANPQWALSDATLKREFRRLNLR